MIENQAFHTVPPNFSATDFYGRHTSTKFFLVVVDIFKDEHFFSKNFLPISSATKFYYKKFVLRQLFICDKFPGR